MSVGYFLVSLVQTCFTSQSLGVRLEEEGANRERERERVIREMSKGEHAVFPHAHLTITEIVELKSECVSVYLHAG